MASIERERQLLSLMHDYCLCLDNHDWAGLASLFDARISLDFEDLLQAPPKVVSGADFAGFVSVVLQPLKTMHVVRNPRFLQSNGTDFVSARMTAYHRNPAADMAAFDLFGTYILGTKASGDGETICELRLRVDWAEGADGVVVTDTPDAQAALEKLLG